MKLLVYLFSGIIFLISCNGNDSEKQIPKLDSGDTNGKVKVESQRDSVAIDSSKSTLVCTRSKVVKNVNKELKLFGANVDVKMDNASLSTDFAIKILNGEWFLTEKKFAGGKIVLNMKSISSVQVGKNKELEIASPDYLDVNKYPTATLFIDSLEPVFNDMQKQLIVGRLQLKDTIGEIRFPATLENGIDKMNPTNYPTKLIGDFHIDGMKWGLNNKNATVQKDDLLFHVVLVTKN